MLKNVNKEIFDDERKPLTNTYLKKMESPLNNVNICPKFSTSSVHLLTVIDFRLTTLLERLKTT